MIWDVPAALSTPKKSNVPHKATGKLRRLGRVNNVHASSIMLICHHNLLVFLAILLRVVQAGSSDSLNSTDGDRLVLCFEVVANLIWKSAHAIFLSQFGICTASSPEEAQLFLTTFGIRSLLRCVCLSNVNLSQLRWLRCCSNKLDETVALKSHLNSHKNQDCALYAAQRLWMEESLGLSLLVAGMQYDLITSAKQ